METSNKSKFKVTIGDQSVDVVGDDYEYTTEDTVICLSILDEDDEEIASFFVPILTNKIVSIQKL